MSAEPNCGMCQDIRWITIQAHPAAPPITAPCLQCNATAPLGVPRNRWADRELLRLQADADQLDRIHKATAPGRPAR